MRITEGHLEPFKDAVRSHWKMSDSYVGEVMKHCTVQSLGWYGEPSASIRENLQADAPKTFVPRVVGFFRTPPMV